MNDFTGFIYLGGDEMLAGYEIGWEYPSDYIAPEQGTTTEHLAELFSSQFEGIYTPFPNPSRPRPPRK